MTTKYTVLRAENGFILFKKETEEIPAVFTLRSDLTAKLLYDHINEEGDVVEITVRKVDKDELDEIINEPEE